MRRIGVHLLLSLLLLAACSGAQSTAVKAPPRPPVRHASEEPGPQSAPATVAPVPPWHCVVRSPAGQCFESKELACAAMGCPNDCSYLYAGTLGGASDVACN